MNEMNIFSCAPRPHFAPNNFMQCVCRIGRYLGGRSAAPQRDVAIRHSRFARLCRCKMRAGVMFRAPFSGLPRHERSLRKRSFRGRSHYSSTISRFNLCARNLFLGSIPATATRNNSPYPFFATTSFQTVIVRPPGYPE